MRLEQFKVGDKVIAYSYSKEFEATVGCIHDDELFLTDHDEDGDSCKDHGHTWRCLVVNGEVTATGYVDRLLRHAPVTNEEVGMVERIQDVIDGHTKFAYSSALSTGIIKPKSLMSNIVKKLKDLTLSAEEKLLRKHGLVDDCFNYTEAMKELAISKLCTDKKAEIVEELKKLEAEEEKR